jgi:hypothetical protein
VPGSKFQVLEGAFLDAYATRRNIYSVYLVWRRGWV